MQCNKPYIMTNMVLLFYHILAILHVTGLKIGENVKQQTWYLIDKQVMWNDATLVIIICEGYCIVLFIRRTETMSIQAVYFHDFVSTTYIYVSFAYTLL